MINETEFVETVKALMELNLNLVEQVHALGAAIVEHGIATPQELGRNLQSAKQKTRHIREKVQKLSVLNLRDILKDFEGPIQ